LGLTTAHFWQLLLLLLLFILSLAQGRSMCVNVLAQACSREGATLSGKGGLLIVKCSDAACGQHQCGSLSVQVPGGAVCGLHPGAAE